MSKAPKPKPKMTFAAVPGRALRDERLQRLHLRALMAIALHDRLSGERREGQGCWAGNLTLAAECGCHITSLSTTITELVEWGYVERSPHPINRRLRVYRVIYNEADQSAFLRSDGFDNGFSTEKVSQRSSYGIVSPDFQEDVSKQGDRDLEYIPQKREDITQKRRKNSVETARLEIGAPPHLETCRNIGAELARIERAMNAGLNPVPDGWLAFIEEVASSGDYTTNQNAARAERLLCRIP